MTTLSQEARAAVRPSTAATACASAVLVLGVALAWSVTVGEAHTMSPMVQGLAQIGRAMSFDMRAPGFVGMWATMMAAMMLPAVAPLVLEYASSRPPLAGTSSRVQFVAGFVAVWTLAGVPVLLALHAMSGAPASTSLDRLGGTVLVVAGAYQFAPSKRHAIAAYRRARRAPGTVAGADPGGAAWDGVHQGLCCVGCCGALMAVLLAVGVMNLTWMAGLTAVCFAEQNWRRGAAVTSATGLVLLVLGLAVVLHPQFLTTLAPSPAMGPMVMH